MLLYNALVMCIHETPRILRYSDIELPKSRAACKKWVLIWQCIVNLGGLIWHIWPQICHIILLSLIWHIWGLVAAYHLVTGLGAGWCFTFSWIRISCDELINWLLLFLHIVFAQSLLGCCVGCCYCGVCRIFAGNFSRPIPIIPRTNWFWK